jgi:hypothetical protein
VFVASDANGCLQLLAVSIHEPEPLVLESTSLPETDAASNGEIACSATGGTPPYIFSLFDTASEGSNWQQLVAGMYEVTVVDSMGCTQSQQVIVDASSFVDFTSNDALLVFPNPMQLGEELFVKSPHPIDECTLIDACGKVVFQSEPSVACFHADLHLPGPGVYTIRFKAGSQYSSIRLVVVE